MKPVSRDRDSVTYMQGVNGYWRELSDAEISEGKHRRLVGGMWDEIGRLQIDFLKSQGMLPHHRLLDVGCGALRGGVHFVRYLDKGNYFGIDVNASLLRAGLMELESEGLSWKEPRLLHNARFEAGRFGEKFDYIIAQSLFTHLFMNHIIRCLKETRKVMNRNSRFFATFFRAPQSAYIEPLEHKSGGVVTVFDTDPFHYSLEEMRFMAKEAGLTVELIGDWSHPRSQQMLCFKLDVGGPCDGADMAGGCTETAGELLARGEDLFDEGDMEGSLRLFAQALEEDPGSTDALNDIGVVLCQKGEFSEAYGYFREALRHDPLRRDVTLNFIALLNLMERHDEARCVSAGYLAAFPDDSEFREMVAGVMKNQRDEKSG